MKKRSTRNARQRTRTASTRRNRRMFFESLEQRAMLVADMLFEGTSNDDQIVVRDAATPGMLTIESTNGTFNAITFEIPTNSLTITGLGGKDTITIASFNSPFNGDLLLEAEGITVNPGVTISTTGQITLTAKAQDDGKIEPRVNLGLIEVPLPVDLTGFYYANPAALIDLTGATLVGIAITLSADASAPINAAPAQFNAFEGTGVYVKSKAEIKIVNTTVTADSLSAIATSSVSSAQEDKADGTVATGDAGISVAVVDSDALAYVAGTSRLTISGDVNIESVNTIDIQSSVDGGATGSVGATLAVAVVGADTRSYISGSSSIADGADSVTITATTNSTASSSATSTAGGAQENTTPGQSKTQKVLSDPDGDGNTEDKASTGDGDIKFAGAVAVTVVNNDTLAYIDTSGSIGSDGKITVTSAATDDASATASGENTGDGATGVGVAVALNIVHVDSNAYLAGTGSLKAAETIDVSASLGVVEGFNASATSGAGASEKVGVAGSLAINVVNTNVNALVKTGATLTLSGGLTLTATSTTNTQTNADAQQEAAGTTGIGASVALGIGNNDANALVENNANFTGASSLSLSASGAHAMSTESTAGAEGGTAVTPVVAISSALNDTVARLGTGVATTVDGDVTIEATQENESTANAEASATGDTAIGASLGLTVAEDTVSATLMRNLTTLSGGLALIGRGSAATRTTAKAGAMGAEEEDETTPADDDQVDKENDKQLAFANKRSEMATGEKSEQTQAPKAETADENGDGKSDSLSVAAAIAVNIHDATSTATIPNGLTLIIDGNVTVSTGANSDTSALADGSAVSGEGGTSVGAAVALNVGQTVNDATVGNAAITSDGLVIEALMTDRDISITPTSTATADIETDSILVGELDDLAVGDEVIYSNGGGASIGGLNNDATYFVVSLEDGRIQLATAADGDAIDLTSVGTGANHKLNRAEKDAIEFNPAEENFAIELGGGTGLETGDAIVYSKGDGVVIGGLTDGETYYAIVDGSGKLELASSYDDALEGNAVEITSVGSGEEHTITEGTHSGGASAISGASGGNIGVAGALAINVTDGSTQAILKSGASVSLRDGSDAGTTVEDVALVAKATTNNRVSATPSDNASGASLGVGLSVGVNVGDHDATAKIEGSTTITTAHNLSLEAVGMHFMLTDAKSGASSEKTAAAGAVATAISDNDTTAMVTSGGAALDVRGDVLISADGSHTQNTTADGQTAGAGAGIGLSFALGIMEDDVVAALDRSVSTGATATAGDITVQANAVVAVSTEASAGAQGAEDSEEEEDTADAETTRQTGFAKERGGMSDRTDISAPTTGDRVNDANSKASSQTKDPGGAGAAGTDTTGADATTETKGSTVKVAAAIGASVLQPEVTARIADGITIHSSGDVNVSALADADVTTLATGLAVADNALGIGAAITVNVALLDVTASVGNGTLNSASLAVEAGTPKDESSDFKLRTLAGGRSQGGTGIAGAVGVNVVISDVSATIANGATVTTDTGAVDVASRNDLGIQTLVGGAAQSQKADPTDDAGTGTGTGAGTTANGNSFGAAIGVNVVENNSVALIGAGATINAEGDVSVQADSSISRLEIDFPDFPIEELQELITELKKAIVPDVTMIVAGAGASSGGAGVAGSAAISVINITTTADIGAGVEVEAQNVIVRAADQLAMTNFAGALAAGLKKGGFGAGLDVVIVNSDTTASIAASNNPAQPTLITASGNTFVEALSVEDVFSLTVNIGIGASTGVAGGAVVVVQNTDTRAFIGDDAKLVPAPAGIAIVRAAGSIYVAADSNTSIDAAAGTATGASGIAPADPGSPSGGSGGTSVGASVVVVVDDDNTEAFVGAGAKVSAFGKNGIAPIDVRNGTYNNDGVQQTDSIRGLAVTATSLDDILTVGIGAAAAAGKESSSIGIGLSVTVNILEGSTQARLDNAATVNETNTDADTSQTVVMRASDKTILNSDVGGAALSLGTGASQRSIGVGGAVAVGIVENDVSALMDGATVNAMGALVMNSHSTSNLDTLAIGVGGAASGGSGGGLALAGAGSGSGNTIDNTVESVIRNNSRITVGGSATVTAVDNSLINTVAGAASLSLSFGSKSKAGAVGVAVAVNDVDNIVRAEIDSSTVTSAGNLTLTSDASPTIKALTVGGAVAAAAGGGTGGALAGAGAAAINNVGGSVEAILRGNSTVTVSGSGELELSAKDRSKITSDVVGASIATSATGGNSAALSVGVSIARNEIDNDVNAFIDRASVTTATGGIEVVVQESSEVNAISVAASVALSGSGANSLALSGGGAEASNVILTKANAYVKDSALTSGGDVSITVTNTASIEAQVVAASASIGSGGTNAGAASIGAARARNFVGWKLDGTASPGESQSYVMNSSINASGDLTVRSIADQDIHATVIAGSAAVSAAGSNALGLSGAGVEVNNKIRVLNNAFIDGDGATGIAAKSITVSADDSSSISAVGVGASLAIAAASTGAAALSIGVSLAKNEIDNDVTATIINADQLSTRAGDVDVSAISRGERVFDLVASGAQAVTIAELDDASATDDDNKASGPNEQDIDKAADAIIIGKLRSQFIARGQSVSDKLQLTAIEDGTSWSLVDKTNNQSYTIRRQANGTLEVSKTNIQAIAVAASAAAGFGGTGIALAGAGAQAENVILGGVHASIQDSRVTSAAAINVNASNESIINAQVISAAASLGIGGALGVAASIGASFAQNSIGFNSSGTKTPLQVQAFVDDSILDAVGAVNIEATTTERIQATTFAGSVAIAGGTVGVAGAGSGVNTTNRVANDVAAFITGNTSDVSGSAISLSAEDTSTITANASAASIAAAIGIGGALSIAVTLAENVIENQIRALHEGGDLTARTGDVVIEASSIPTIVANGIAGGVAAGVGVGAAAGLNVKNTIGGTTTAAVRSGSVKATSGQLQIASQSTAKGNLKGTGLAAALGIGAAVGAVLTESNVTGTTESLVGGTIDVDRLIVTANGIAEAGADSNAFTGGIVGVGVNKASSSVTPTVRASVLDQANITVSGDATVSAVSSAVANSKSMGVTVGAFNVGLSSADLTLRPTVHVAIGNQASLVADGKLSITSQLLRNEGNVVTTASGGGLAGTSGALSKQTVVADVQTNVGRASNLAGSTGLDVLSSSLVKLVDEGKVEVGGGVSLQNAETKETINTTARTIVGAASKLQSARGTVNVDSTNQADVKSESKTRFYGLGSGATADATTRITGIGGNDLAQTVLGPGSSVTGHRVNIASSVSTIKVDSDADGQQFAVGGLVNTISVVDVVGRASVSQQTGARILGGAVTVTAQQGTIDINGLGDQSKGLGLAPVHDGNVFNNVVLASEVNVAENAEVAGNTIDIRAKGATGNVINDKNNDAVGIPVSKVDVGANVNTLAVTNIAGRLLPGSNIANLVIDASGKVLLNQGFAGPNLATGSNITGADATINGLQPAEAPRLTIRSERSQLNVNTNEDTIPLGTNEEDFRNTQTETVTIATTASYAVPDRFAEVTIDNRSGKHLDINGIDVLLTGATVTPVISPTATLTNAGVNRLNGVVVKLKNASETSAANVFLDGAINNPGGITTIETVSGSILDRNTAAESRINTAALNLSAGLNLGGATAPIQTDVSQAIGTMPAPSLKAIAGGSIHLALTATTPVQSLEILGIEGQTGNVTVDFANRPIALAGPIIADNAGTITITNVGTITDENTTGPDLSGGQLSIQTSTGDIGTLSNSLETSLGNIEVATTGGLFLDNERSLTIGGVGPAVGLNVGGVTHIATSTSLNVNENIRGTGDVRLEVRDEADATANQIVLANNVQIESTGGNLHLLSGDSMSLRPGHKLIANSGTGELTIAIDWLNADPGVPNAFIVPTSADDIIRAAHLRVVGNSDDDSITINDLFMPILVEASAGQDSVNAKLITAPGASTRLTNIDVETIDFQHTSTSATTWQLDAEFATQSIPLFALPNAIVNVAHLSSGANRIVQNMHTLGSSFENLDVDYTLGSGVDTVTVLAMRHPALLNLGGGNDQVTVGGMRGSGADAVPVDPGNVLRPLSIVGGAGQDTFVLVEPRTGANFVPIGRLGSTPGGAGLVQDYGSLETAGSPRRVEFSQFEQTTVNLGETASIFTILDTVTATTINSGTADDVVNVRKLSSPTIVNLQAGNDTVNIQGGGALLTVDGGTTAESSIDLPDGGDRVLLGTTRSFDKTVVNVADGLNAIKLFGTGWEVGQELILMSDDVAPGGLVSGGIYYAVPSGRDIIRLARTRAQAMAASPTNENDPNIIPLTDGGQGQHYFTLAVDGKPLWPTIQGSLTGTDASPLLSFAQPGEVGVTGTATFTNIEKANVLLGFGDDTFEVNSSIETLAIELRGGPGDDEFVLRNVPGRSIVISGDSGKNDRVRVLVSGDPIANQFTSLTIGAGIERLVVDNTSNNAAMDWIVSQGSMHFVAGQSTVTANTATNTFAYDTTAFAASRLGSRPLANGDLVLLSSTGALPQTPLLTGPAPRPLVTLDASQFYVVRELNGGTLKLSLPGVTTPFDLTTGATGTMSIRRVSELVSLEGAANSDLLAGGNDVATLSVVTPGDTTVDVNANQLRIIEGARVLDHESNLSLQSFPSERVDGLQGVRSVVTTSNHFVFAAGTAENKIAMFIRRVDPNDPTKSLLTFVKAIDSITGRVPSSPSVLKLSPDERFLYVIGDGYFSVFAVAGAATPDLTWIQDIVQSGDGSITSSTPAAPNGTLLTQSINLSLTLEDPTDLEFSRSLDIFGNEVDRGTHVYVTDAGAEDGIVIFRRDVATGLLTEVVQKLRAENSYGKSIDVGSDVVDRPNLDLLTGATHILDEPFSGTISTRGVYQFYARPGTVGQRITPLLLQPIGEDDHTSPTNRQFQIFAIGETRTIEQIGINEFEFKLPSTPAQTGSGLYFGWTDGSPALAGNAIVPYTDGTSSNTYLFNSGYSVGNATPLTSFQPGRAYSMDANFQTAVVQGLNNPLSIAVSPDGNRLVTGDSLGQIATWVGATGQAYRLQANSGWFPETTGIPTAVNNLDFGRQIDASFTANRDLRIVADDSLVPSQVPAGFVLSPATASASDIIYGSYFNPITRLQVIVDRANPGIALAQIPEGYISLPNGESAGALFDIDGPITSMASNGSFLFVGLPVSDRLRPPGQEADDVGVVQVYSIGALGQLTPFQHLVASTDLNVLSKNFGASISVDGNRSVIPYRAADGSQQVQVWDFNGSVWVRSHDFVGGSLVDLDRDTFIVGRERVNVGDGNVKIVRRGTDGVYRIVLDVSLDPIAVSLDGNTATIVAEDGTIYVYRETSAGWQERDVFGSIAIKSVASVQENGSLPNRTQIRITGLQVFAKNENNVNEWKIVVGQSSPPSTVEYTFNSGLSGGEIVDLTNASIDLTGPATVSVIETDGGNDPDDFIGFFSVYNGTGGPRLTAGNGQFSPNLTGQDANVRVRYDGIHIDDIDDITTTTDFIDSLGDLVVIGVPRTPGFSGVNPPGEVIAYREAEQQSGWFTTGGQISDITFSPDGTTVYATDALGKVFVLHDDNGSDARIPASLLLDPLQNPIDTNAIPSLAGASSVRVSPDGARVYVTAEQSGAVTVFDRNGALATPNDLGTNTLIPNNGGNLNGAADSALESPFNVQGGLQQFLVTASSGSSTLATFELVGNQFVPSQGNNPNGRNGLGDGNPLDSVTRVQALTINPLNSNVNNVNQVFYVAAPLDDAMFVFNRNAAGDTRVVQRLKDDRAGASGQDDLSLAGASDIVVSPDGRFVYIAAVKEGTTGEISIYERVTLNDATGTPFDGLRYVRTTPTSVFNTTGNNDIITLRASIDGGHVYASGPGGLQVFARDLNNGNLTNVAATLPITVSDLKFASSSRAYAVRPSTKELLVFNRAANGTLTQAAAYTTRLDNPRSVEIGDAINGQDTVQARFVYVASAGTNSISVFDEFASDGSDTQINGNLHHVQIVREGVSGVRGLGGVHVLQASAPVNDTVLQFSGSELDVAESTINTDLPHGLRTEQLVTFRTASEAPGGVQTEDTTLYYVRKIDKNRFQLFTTPESARSGDPTGLVAFTAGDGSYALHTSLPEGAFLYALGHDANSIVVFQRELDMASPEVGQLTFLQVIRNRVGNATGGANNGLFRPDSIVAPSGDTSTVFVSSSFDPLLVGAPGGFVSLHNNADDSPSLPPIETRLSFSGIKSLNVTTGSGSDIITVNQAPMSGDAIGAASIPFTANTGGGVDSLTLNDAAEGVLTQADLGAGDDAFTIRTLGDAASNIQVRTGDGTDSVLIEQVATRSGVTVWTEGPTDNSDWEDFVRVAAPGIGRDGNVTLNASSEDQFSYEVEGVEGNDQIVNANNAAGNQLQLFWNDETARLGSVFTMIDGNTQLPGNIEFQTSDSVVLASVANPGEIAQGSAVTFTSTSTGVENQVGSFVTYAWDLNGDGLFTELITTEPTVTLSWQDLIEFGFAARGGGDYRVPLRVTRNFQTIDPNTGETRVSSTEQSDSEVTVTVNDAAPVALVNGGQAETNHTVRLRGPSFMLPLAVTGNDPLGDEIVSWTINWGDGSSAQTIGPVNIASHLYSRPGRFDVIVTGLDENGLQTQPVTTVVSVAFDSQSVSAGSAYTIDEAQPITLSGKIAGSPESAVWIVNGQNAGAAVLQSYNASTNQTVASLTLTWQQLQAVGVTNDGTFSVVLRATYAGTANPIASALVNLVVNNVAPEATFFQSGPIQQGETATVGFRDIVEPNDVLTFSYNFGTGFVTGEANTLVPASLGPGTHLIRGRISDGTVTRDYETTLIINDLPPSIQIDGGLPDLIEVNEGATTTLTGSYENPGGGAVTLTTSIGSINHNPTTKTFTWTFSPTDNRVGVARETISITDAEGSKAELDLNLIVSNVAPHAVFVVPTNVLEGATGVTVSLTDLTDASATDLTSGLRFSFDFGDDGSFEIGDGSYAGGVTSASVAVPAIWLADDGEVPIRVNVVDKDGGVTQLTKTLSVANVSATLGPLTVTPAQITGSGAVRVTGTFAGDPSAVDTHTIQVDWGDGRMHRLSADNVIGIAQPGSGYSNATGVAVTGGSGTGMTFDIATEDGRIIEAIIRSPGNGYQVGDVLTVSGGGGNAVLTLGGFNQANGTFTAVHFYSLQTQSLPNPIPVTVRVYDDDGGVDTRSTSIAISGAPTITSGANVTVDEQQTLAVDVQSNDTTDSEGSGLTYRITGGADQARFSVQTASGIVSFNVPPVFDSPIDANQDNVYEVQVTVTDSTGLTDVQDFAITVKEVANEPNLAPLDVTGSGRPNPFQDGILILRYMFQLGDDDLQGLSPAGATRTTGAEIKAYLDQVRDSLDINGDGSLNPFQDGIIILRYLFQLGEEDLIGFSPAGSTRTTGEQIKQYLDTLMPSGATGEPLLIPMTSDAEGEFNRFLQSILDPADVNGDGQVTALDALNVINELNRDPDSLDVGEWSKYDVNRDGAITARDALFVINRLNEQSAEAEQFMAMSSDDDDEPENIDRLFADDTFLQSLF